MSPPQSPMGVSDAMIRRPVHTPGEIVLGACDSGAANHFRIAPLESLLQQHGAIAPPWFAGGAALQREAVAVEQAEHHGRQEIAGQQQLEAIPPRTLV